MAREGQAVVELGAAAFERVFADHVHVAREAAGGIGGRGHLGDLDARDVIDRDLDEVEFARRTDACGIGHGGAVSHYVGHGAAEAADRDRGRHLVLVADGHARQEAHEFGDVAFRDVAEGVGGDDVLDVRREALLVGRERLAFGEFGSREHERIEFHDAGLVAGGRPAGEADVAHDGLARRERQCDLLRIQPGIKRIQRHRAAGDPGEPEDSVAVGERGEVGALDGHADVEEVLAGDLALHAAGDGAGRSLRLRGRRKGEQHQGTRCQKERRGFHDEC